MSSEITPDELASKRIDRLVIEIGRLSSTVEGLKTVTPRVIDRTAAELRREIQAVKDDIMIEVECMIDEAMRERAEGD
jgi:hypothetical protein